MRSERSSLRVDGYVRVSRVGYRRGERFISPAVQRERIEQWALAHGASILEIWEELDESGGRPDRLLLETAVERIEQGASQGLVVANVDRFGRSLLHGLITLERIEQAGGTFVSVEEGFDLTSDTGRLVLHIMLAMAQWYRDRARASWETSVSKAIARGLFVGSQTPVGYRKLRSGRLRPDLSTAPFVTEIFARRAAGETLWKLARYLEENGVRTAYGNPGWQTSSVWRVISNRVYVGEVRSGRFVRESAHPALVDEASWQAAQVPRRKAPARGSLNVLLSGLLRCASCGMKMHAFIRAKKSTFYYGCKYHFAAGQCPAPAYMIHGPLEACVTDVVLDLLARRRTPPNAALRTAEQEVVHAQRALASYRDSDRVLSTLGERAFAAGLAVRVDRVRDASLKLISARTRRGQHDLPPTPEIEAAWPELSIAERRTIIGQVVDCVFVLPGNRKFDERIWICPTGKEPSGLSRPGDKHTRLRAFAPREGWVSARYTTARPVRWSGARLERELRAFVSDRREWPATASFRAAGRSRLHRQMEMQGGEQHWAARIGLPIRRRRWREWSDAEIRIALGEFLQGRSDWPSASDFKAEQLTSLRAAISRTGGVQRWAAEFDIQRANSRCNGSVPYWTDERIGARVAELCQGRDTFPSQPEFIHAGLGGMRKVMEKRGGAARWARATGLPLQRTGHR